MKIPILVIKLASRETTNGDYRTDNSAQRLVFMTRHHLYLSSSISSLPFIFEWVHIFHTIIIIHAHNAINSHMACPCIDPLTPVCEDYGAGLLPQATLFHSAAYPTKIIKLFKNQTLKSFK